MRTLKKSLALVLALVMVLGLGVIGASADNALDSFTDANEVGDAYVEAMGVMTGLGVIDGVGTAAPVLDPDGTYTREQAAKIITYMLLGKDTAEALTATDTPFTDVPATSWAAKYISYCVEAGIIDGMTPTTFEPYATLTGYQWAKMLLSAVGFGAKGEFVGDTWSIGTATIARQVNLFKGDLAGGDHKPLQRQQAILYAFNALTGVNVVVYSEALGDYIERYTDVIDRFTYEGTLGWNVYNLANVSGVVTANEGTGAAATTLSETAAFVPTTFAANTGLDLMYHAVRIWFINNTNRTAVYVKDLATSTEYECDEISAATAWGKVTPAAGKVKVEKTIGEGVTYVSSIVDNTAYSGAANYAHVKVDFDVYTATMGRTDSVSGKTTVNNIKNTATNAAWGTNTYKTANIKSDISELSIGDPVILLKIANGIDDLKAAVYVAPITSTTATVTSINLETKAITLSNGTVLNRSALFNSEAAYNYLVSILAGATHDLPAAVFTLDTHGHYMGITTSGLTNVAFFTGTTQESTSHGTWTGEELYNAQFLNLETGEPFTVAVTKTWRDTHDKTDGKTDDTGYFDVTTSLYGDKNYSPVPMDSYNNVIDGKYVLLMNAGGAWLNPNITSSTYTITGIRGTAPTISLNPASTKFVIGLGFGSNVTYKAYNNLSEVLADCATVYGVPATSITLNKAIAVVEEGVGGYYATTIFAYGSVNTANGGYIYFTKPGSGWSVTDSYYYTVPSYVNGEKVDVRIETTKIEKDNVTKAGLYAYSIGANGVWDLTYVAGTTVNDASAFVQRGGGVYQITSGTTTYTVNASTVKVVDVTDPAVNDPVVGFEGDAGLLGRLANNESFSINFQADTSNNVSVIYVTAV